METPIVEAIGGDFDELIEILRPWAAAIVKVGIAGGGYPGGADAIADVTYGEVAPALADHPATAVIRSRPRPGRGGPSIAYGPEGGQMTTDVQPAGLTREYPRELKLASGKRIELRLAGCNEPRRAADIRARAAQDRT